MKPDFPAAIAFLQKLAPEGPWTVTAIQPDGKAIETRTFRPETLDGLKAWLAEHNGKRNCYYALNPLKRDMKTKAALSDVAALAWLHVDVDPKGAEPVDPALFGARLPAGAPRPTALVFSGGGYQALYRLETALAIDGVSLTPDAAAQWNRGLETLFGGDHCHNVDRILRLPGTINLPNAAKRTKGRVPALARVEWFEDSTYPLSAFTPAPLAPPAGALASVRADAVPIADVAELDQWRVPDRVKVIIVQGRHPDQPKEGDDSRSAWVFDAVCALVRCRVPDSVILGVLIDPAWGISESVLAAPGGAAKYAARQIAKAKDVVAKDELGGKQRGPTPRELAVQLLDRRGAPLLRFNGEWLTHQNGAYRPREEEGIRREVYEAFPVFRRGGVTDVVDALKGVVHHDRNALTPPCWLDRRPSPDPAALLVLRNGILDLETGDLSPHDPELFTRNALDFDYDPSAPAPERWLQFLRDVWPGDDEADSHTALQQMFGYLLTPDTSQQKLFVLVGPTRSGKGTIGRVLEKLLGRSNVCAPSMSSLAEPFGLQCMIGRQLALVSDMRLSARTDQAAVAETLLKVSGEDNVNVARKNREDWEGRLSVRFVIMSNEAPTLNDPSGALLGRYIVMQMRQSFLGREDRGLDAVLRGELSGILNWAIAGWRELKARGHLLQPTSAEMMIRAMDRISSPIRSFIDEWCVKGPDESVGKDALYAAFKRWAMAGDLPWHASKEMFGKQLLAAAGQHIREVRPYVDIQGRRARQWQWSGLGLAAPPWSGSGPGELPGLSAGSGAQVDDGIPF